MYSSSCFSETMNDQDVSQVEKKRFHWLKLGFVFAIILKQLLLIARCLVVYFETEDLTRFVLFLIYIPCFVIGTIFSGIPLLAIEHELNHDMRWFRLWHYRIFVLYSLFYWFHLYPIIGVLICIYTYVRSDGDTYTGGLYFDIAEPVLCLLIQSLMLMLLFRPFISCINSNVITNEQQAVYSVSQRHMTFTGLEEVQCTTSDVIYQSNESCCERKSLYMCSIIFYCIYCGAFVALIYEMVDQTT